MFDILRSLKVTQLCWLWFSFFGFVDEVFVLLCIEGFCEGVVVGEFDNQKCLRSA
jgi:hypothetical protein